MPDTLSGQTFLWSCWDPSRVVTAAVCTMLDDHFDVQVVRPRLLEAATAAEVASAATMQACSLAIWTLRHEPDTIATCDAIAECTRQQASGLRICYLDVRLSEYNSILLEAGAQIVVSELPSLQCALTNVLDSLPRSSLGFHPLTSGLAARLPWSDVDAARRD